MVVLAGHPQRGGGDGGGSHWPLTSCLLMSSSDAYWLTQGDNLQPSKQQRASMGGPNDLFFGEGGIVIVLNQTKINHFWSHRESADCKSIT